MLITLGIIGVVAALTMPALVANYQKQVAITQLKKAYSTLNQAMKLSEVDNGDYQTWDMTLTPLAYIEKYWLPYFKVMQVCHTPEICGYSSVTPYFELNGAPNGLNIVNTSLRIPFVTTDGIAYTIGKNSVSSPTHEIYVDLNGAKPPNQFGKDVFRLVRVPDRGVLPMNYDGSEAAINENCSKTGTGHQCAAKIIMLDNWEIRDDYPW